MFFFNKRVLWEYQDLLSPKEPSSHSAVSLLNEEVQTEPYSHHREWIPLKVGMRWGCGDDPLLSLVAMGRGVRFCHGPEPVRGGLCREPVLSCRTSPVWAGEGRGQVGMRRQFGVLGEPRGAAEPERAGGGETGRPVGGPLRMGCTAS